MKKAFGWCWSWHIEQTLLMRWTMNFSRTWSFSRRTMICCFQVMLIHQSRSYFFSPFQQFFVFLPNAKYFCSAFCWGCNLVCVELKYSMKRFNWGNIHSMSSCVKQVWLVMLINFCLLHLRCLGSLRWLSATVSSERATSSLSGAGGNLLHTSNWTKCLSNSEPSHTDRIIIQTRCQQRFPPPFSPLALRRVFGSTPTLPVLCRFSNSPPPTGPRRNKPCAD